MSRTAVTDYVKSNFIHLYSLFIKKCASSVLREQINFV